MNTAKEEVQALLEKLPENYALEDIQSHLYVVEKVSKSVRRAEAEGTISQDDVERKLHKWSDQ